MDATSKNQDHAPGNDATSRPAGPRIFFQGVSTADHGPVWAKNLWAFKRVLSESAAIVPLDVSAHGRLARGRIARYFASRRARRRACDLARPHLDPHGPNILWIEIYRGQDLVSAINLSPIWEAFSHRILVVNDAIFPEWTRTLKIRPLTRIYSFSAELAERWSCVLDSRADYLCPSTDVLQNRCIRPYRPIDVLAVGRRDLAVDSILASSFRSLGRDRLFVDPNSRSQPQHKLGDEYRGLMDLYSKSKITLCFEASGLERYRSLSPLNERWIHAWASGCTVVGRAPHCPKAREVMDWPESSLELPEDPAESVAFIEALIEDPEGLERRRRRNVIEALRRHDTRHRVSRVFGDLSIDPPPELRRGLQLVADAADQIERSGQSGLGDRTEGASLRL